MHPETESHCPSANAVPITYSFRFIPPFPQRLSLYSKLTSAQHSCNPYPANNQYPQQQQKGEEELDKKDASATWKLEVPTGDRERLEEKLQPAT
jgi:hypothetical protein